MVNKTSSKSSKPKKASKKATTKTKSKATSATSTKKRTKPRTKSTVKATASSSRATGKRVQKKTTRSTANNLHLNDVGFVNSLILNLTDLSSKERMALVKARQQQIDQNKQLAAQQASSASPEVLTTADFELQHKEAGKQPKINSEIYSEKRVKIKNAKTLHDHVKLHNPNSPLVRFYNRSSFAHTAEFRRDHGDIDRDYYVSFDDMPDNVPNAVENEDIAIARVSFVDTVQDPINADVEKTVVNANKHSDTTALKHLKQDYVQANEADFDSIMSKLDANLHEYVASAPTEVTDHQNPQGNYINNSNTTANLLVDTQDKNSFFIQFSDALNKTYDFNLYLTFKQLEKQVQKLITNLLPQYTGIELDHQELETELTRSGNLIKVEEGYLLTRANLFKRYKITLAKGGFAFAEPAGKDGSFTGKKLDDNIFISPVEVVERELLDGEVIYADFESQYHVSEAYIFAAESFDKRLVVDVDLKEKTKIAYIPNGREMDVIYHIEIPEEYKNVVGAFLAVVRMQRILNPQSGGYIFKYTLERVFNSSSKIQNIIDSILVKFELPDKFPTNVVKKAQAFGDSVPVYDPKYRKDLTHLNFVTIDGEDARDFDDAVYVETLPTGGFKLYVAIADVSYYVHDNDVIDQEARGRATSIYFPTQVIPMLPEELSNGLCSLNPHVPRYTLCCEMEISAKGELTAYDFYQACIISKKRFTYNMVQKIIDAKFALESEFTTPELNQLVKVLYSCYHTLVTAKHARGAISIDSAEPKFKFTADGDVEEIYFESRRDAHKLIEEMMIIANVAAAKFVYDHGIAAPNRNHAMPEVERVERLNTYLATFDMALPPYPTTHDYRELVEKIDDLEERDAIFTNILRSLPRAVYETDSSGHFGLALEKYAQFTSPIRRYPDLLLHRSIKSIIFAKQKRIGKTEGGRRYSDEEMDALCAHCSETEFKVEKASYDFLDWIKCLFMMRHLGDEFTGIVSHVTKNGAFVTIPEYQIDGFLAINSRSRSPLRLNVRDKIEIVVSDINLNERTITFTPKFLKSNKGGYNITQPKSTSRRNNNSKSTGNNSKSAKSSKARK